MREWKCVFTESPRTVKWTEIGGKKWSALYSFDTDVFSVMNDKNEVVASEHGLTMDEVMTILDNAEEAAK